MDIYEVQITTGPLKRQKFYICGSVIYLVGPNGAGKTQILHAIRMGWCTVNQLDGNGHLNQYRAIDWSEQKYDASRGASRSFSDINAFFKEIGQETVELRAVHPEPRKVKEVRNEKTGAVTKSFDVVEVPRRNNVPFTGVEFSEGTAKFYSNFSWNGQPERVFPEDRNWPTGGHRAAPATFVLWDEPENSLHPSLQKQLPEKVDKWLDSNRKMLGFNQRPARVYVLIATHSPFVLSGISKSHSHHVVCLDNCEVVDQTFDPKEPEKSQLTKVRIIANKLLGVGLEDFFPERLVYAESSIQILLEDIAENLDSVIPDFFVNPTGDDDGDARLSFLRGHLKALKRLRSRWPEKDLFKPRVDYLADDVEFRKQLEQASKDEDLDLRVFSIGTKQLEDAYPLEWVNEFLLGEENYEKEWDGKQLFSTYLFNHLKVPKVAQGKLKCRLAKVVAARIRSKKDIIDNLPDVESVFKEWGVI